jgi:hypothetical protein
VFEGGRNTVDANANTGWEKTLTVYQILPIDAVPKLELSMGQNDWWSWMQNTPFQVSGDFLYYSDQVEVTNFGPSDVIIMVDLNTGLKTTLLTPEPGLGRYDIYNWRLVGDELHFSALNQTNTTVVTGIIDTSAFDPAVDSSVYLSLTEVASATGAVSAIQDIEVIRQVSTEIDPGDNLFLDFFQSPENFYSMSIDFSATMDLDSVESNLTLVDDAETNIAMMKVWVNKTLHLIPDLDLDGLGNSSTTALTPSTRYTLTAGEDTTDKFGNGLLSAKSASLTTGSGSGWYNRNFSELGVSAAGLVFAGRATNGGWGWSTHDVLAPIGGLQSNFRVQFEAKSLSSDGIQLILIDLDGTNQTVFHMGLGSRSWLNYNQLDADYKWIEKDTPEVLNGNWQTYSITVLDNNLIVETKLFGVGNFQPVDGLTRIDLAALTGANNRFLLRVRQPVALANIELYSLNEDGTDLSYQLGGTWDYEGTQGGLGWFDWANADLTDTVGLSQ